MTYTLYYSPGAASMAVHWMLIEARIPFEARVVDIDTGAQHSAEYLRLNPAGRVPTLVVDGVPRHECTALLMLLAERHAAVGLASPHGSPDRAEWLELIRLRVKPRSSGRERIARTRWASSAAVSAVFAVVRCTGVSRKYAFRRSSQRSRRADQSAPPHSFVRMLGYRFCRIMRLDTPLRLFTSDDTETLGG
jgi:glutathione S-transferase